MNLSNPIINENNYDFNGYLMHKDIIVAQIINTEVFKVFNEVLMPVIMINSSYGSFESWLQSRIIDTQRVNSRLLRQKLNIYSDIPKEILIKSRAVSIVDSYWLKRENENITFKEIQNMLSDGLNNVALHGSLDKDNFSDLYITPELTNIGSFEKCWKLIDGHWYMIKKGTCKENFAEVLLSNIANHLGFNAVKYESLEDGKLVKCKDFTNNGEVNFEPMFSFVLDYWDIDNSIKIINKLGYIEDFLNITFMDALCYNIDRHTFNFGILIKDGNPIGLAPNFDNNLALSGFLNDKSLEKIWYSTSFTKKNYIPVLKLYNYEIPNINLHELEEIILYTVKGFPTLMNENGFTQIVSKIIRNNYKELLKLI